MLARSWYHHTTLKKKKKGSVQDSIWQFARSSSKLVGCSKWQLITCIIGARCNQRNLDFKMRLVKEFRELQMGQVSCRLTFLALHLPYTMEKSTGMGAGA